MNKKKVDSILKAATMAGVALGASAIVDADVVYAEELGSESTDSELYKQQSMTEATSDSLAEESGTDMGSGTLYSASESNPIAVSCSLNQVLDENIKQTENVDEGAKILQTIEDTVGNYGVVAENAQIKADFESNVKGDWVEFDGNQTVGSSKKYSDSESEVIYIGDFNPNEYVQANRADGVPTDVVIGLKEGDTYTITVEADGQKIVTVTDKNGKEKSIKINNNGGDVRCEATKQTVASELGTVTELSEELMEQGNKDNSIKVDVYDKQNQYKVLHKNHQISM